MLTITIPAREYYDEAQGLFVNHDEVELKLEHSLVSLAKWEAKWNKPFLGEGKKGVKTLEESVDYVRCMTLNENIDPVVYRSLTSKNFEDINEYLKAPMTATWFSNKQKGKPNREQVTAELIYYWMIALNIPFECQYWHLNRLLTLIRVCNIKNTPPKKMSKGEIMKRNRALNAARRSKNHSKG